LSGQKHDTEAGEPGVSDEAPVHADGAEEWNWNIDEDWKSSFFE